MAIDGGRPAFDSPRLTGAPNDIDRVAVHRRLDEMFDRHRLTNNGPLVQEFEERLAAIVGVGDVVTVANGTLGLLIAAVGLGVSGTVAVPSWTFAGTVQPLVWAGLRPVFLDVDPYSHSLDPDGIGRLPEADLAELALVVPVHLWGRPCNVDGIAAAVSDRGIPVLYDAAHAIGATHDGRAVGTFGRAEVFGFHATKWLTSIEGGAIATDDPDLALHCRRLRNFGFAGEGDIPVNGINAKMSEMHAAVGLTQLDRFDELRDVNRRRWDAYASCFDGHPDIRLVPPENRGSSPRGYVIAEVTPPGVAAPARGLQQILEAENVHVRRYFDPGVHRLEAFARFAPNAPLPVTESLSTCCVALPTGEGVDLDDVVRIAGLVIEGLDRLARDVRDHDTVVAPVEVPA
jgi:dTDP-4-amino-4,6-dideoxygalactose transaminase